MSGEDQRTRLSHGVVPQTNGGSSRCASSRADFTFSVPTSGKLEKKRTRSKTLRPFNVGQIAVGKALVTEPTPATNLPNFKVHVVPGPGITKPFNFKVQGCELVYVDLGTGTGYS